MAYRAISAAGLILTPRIDEQARWLAAAGNLDVSAIEAFEARAGELVEIVGRHCVVIDLTDVASLDAAALGALMRVTALSRHVARPLLIVRPCSGAALLLRLSGVDRHLPIVDSRSAAADAAAASAA